MRERPFIERRYLFALGGLLLLWAAVAFRIGPVLIEAAYHDNGPALLHGIIEGQSQHGLDRYMRAWWRLVTIATAAAVIAAGAAIMVIRKRAALRRALTGFLRSDPTVDWKHVLVIALCAGIVIGLVETIPDLLALAATGDPREAPAPESLWLSPLVATLALMVVSALLLAALRAWNRPVSLRVPVALFGTVAAFTLVTALPIGIKRSAAILLSLGVGVQLSRVAARHGSAVPGLLRRGAVALAAVPILIAMYQATWPWIAERRAVAALPAAAEGARNVLFIILDTVRAQSLSLYGYARPTTPHLEKWAERGVVFDWAIATAPWTLPSHASMFTGRWAHEVGTDFDRALDDTHATLAEALRSRGYVTGGFVANMVFCSAASGLGRGFIHYEDHPIDVSAALAASWLTRRPLNRIRALLGHHDALGRKSGGDVSRDFLDWQASNADRPFFAFLNLFDAHHPYEVQRPFVQRFTSRMPRYWRLGWRQDYSEQEVTEFVDAYDATIAYLDHTIDELLSELERRNVLRNTLVIVTADHGEHLGERGLFIHANSLYMPLLHVPLVAILPDRIPGGLRVNESVSLRDLPATVLDLLGADASAFHGRSLARFWSGDSATDRARSVLLADLTANEFAASNSPIARGPMQSAILGPYHYIRNGDAVEELYDYRSDEKETRNMAAAGVAASTLQSLRAATRSMRDTATSTAHVAGVSGKR